MPVPNGFGARLNYAQHILRNEKPGKTALLYANEDQVLSMDWDKLGNDVRILATNCEKMGIKPGDRIACYMTNIPQAATALLACSSIGAIWSSCSPDFGTHSVLDRLTQIEPKVLFCVDGYHYKGKAFNRKEEVRNIVETLTSIEKSHLPAIPRSHRYQSTVEDAILWDELLDRPAVSAEDFEFEQVPFDYPLWILFSSGTTGLPKA